MNAFKSGELSVYAAESIAAMAERAAADFSAAAKPLLERLPEINVVFSGAESQAVFHAALRERRDIGWKRVNAFAVDEFYAPGLPPECAVCAQPKRDLYRHLPFKSVNIIDFAPGDVEAERRRYEALITKHPPHICCLGIGISGHIALNEPGSTDFKDTQRVRFVKICGQSKRQLEKDPNFSRLPAIPDSGLTITIPTLLSASAVLAVVPYSIKREIIAEFLKTPVTPDFPASILKRKAGAFLYLDNESYPPGSRYS